MNVTQEFIKSIIPQAICMGVMRPIEGSWSVDSRLIEPGAVFVALPGAHVDGHDFIEDALRRGAFAIMMSQQAQEKCKQLLAAYEATRLFIIVPCPEEALYALAYAWRRKFSYPVIGITGSVGKTTTKEILNNILKQNGMLIVVSQGNQNTCLGMSLNILNMRDTHQVAIFEMGISKRGEMAKLAQLAHPTIAVITTIGHSHMEGLGSLADIATEKRDIFKYLPDDGIGIIDGDQPLLAAISYRHPVVKFGKKMINQLQARKIQVQVQAVSFQLKLYKERYAITLPTEHVARIYNVLAAAAVAYTLGVTPAIICQGIQEPVAVKGRFNRYTIKGTDSMLIDDSYNANPESMKAALQAFEHIEGAAKKIVVLGDMLELGINSPFWHRQLGRFLRKVPSVREVIFIGEQVKWAHKMVPLGLRVHHVADWQQALPLIRDQLHEKLLVLVKASRGIGLNNLVDELVHKQQ